MVPKERSAPVAALEVDVGAAEAPPWANSPNEGTLDRQPAIFGILAHLRRGPTQGGSPRDLFRRHVPVHSPIYPPLEQGPQPRPQPWWLTIIHQHYARRHANDQLQLGKIRAGAGRQRRVDARRRQVQRGHAWLGVLPPGTRHRGLGMLDQKKRLLRI